MQNVLLLQRRTIKSHLAHRYHIEGRKHDATTPIRAPGRCGAGAGRSQVDVRSERSKMRLRRSVLRARRHQMIPPVFEDGVVKRLGHGTSASHEGDALSEGLDDASFLAHHRSRDGQKRAFARLGANLLSRDDDEDGMKKDGTDAADKKGGEEVGTEVDVGEVALGGIFYLRWGLRSCCCCCCD